MSFTHGMNVDEVRTQGTESTNQGSATSQSRGDANDTIYNFVADSWWGTDAEQYLDDWMSTVDPLYSQLAEALGLIGTDIGVQADSQEEVSAS